MPTPLLERIRSAAIATPALTALLGTNPFRWYDKQLVPGSAFPAVVQQVISDSQSYSLTTRLPNSNSRVQFTIWGVNTAAGMTSIANVEAALQTFLDGLNLIGISGLVQYPNFIVAGRDGFYPLPQPGNPQRLIDAMIYANNSL